MADFSDIFKSPKYISAYNKQKTGTEAGILWVENPSDRLFWELVVSRSLPERYIVRPYSKSEISGKRILEKEYSNLHSNLIVGIDSDFDFVCPERHENAKEMNINPFVLHTFCYSRESFACSKESLSDILNKCYYQENTPSEFHQALWDYSSIIYDALCVFGYLHNLDWNKYKESDFKSAIKLSDGGCLLDEKLCVNKIELDNVKKRVVDYVEKLSSHIVDNDEFDNFKINLRMKGIEPEIAYMFINGHFLYDALVKVMINKILSSNKKADIEKVNKTNNSDGYKKDKRNEISNHFKKCCDIGTLMHNSHAFSENIFFKKILDKASQLNKA
ncbi:DUF4435 domain-containing protein [Xenorhabdus szentirmaii]